MTNASEVPMFRSGAFPLKPGLYLVATPIGNLRDITLRALDTLAQADIVVCEDTRVTGKLLTHYQITASMRSYNDHNAARQRPGILAALAEGQRVALVSDAGSPLIADPGFKLVREAAEAGYRVESIPGPSAVIAALQVSGLATDQFRFVGFQPAKTGKRRQQLESLATEPSTMVFYESGPRLKECLTDMADVFGDRPAAVARELTKLHETTLRGTVAELTDRFDTPPKGEIVIVVSGHEPATMDDAAVDQLILEALQAGAPTKAVAASVSEQTGAPRRAIYQRVLALAKKAGAPARPETE